MAVEVERLVVKMEADFEDLKKAFEETTRRVDKFAGDLEQSLGKSTKRMDSNMNALTKSLGAFAAGLIAKALKDFSIGTMQAASDLGHFASQVGVAAEALQGYRAQASDSGIKTSSFDSALSSLAARLGEVQRGGGRLSSWLQQAAPDLYEAMRAAKSTDEAFLAVADKMSRLATDSDKATLASKLFGESNARLYKIMEGGRKTLLDNNAAMKEAGQIIGRDAVKAAQDLDERWAAMSRTWSKWTTSVTLWLGERGVDLVTYIKSLGEAASMLRTHMNASSGNQRFNFVGGNFADAMLGFRAATVQLNTHLDPAPDALERLQRAVSPWTVTIGFTASDRALMALQEKVLAAQEGSLAASVAGFERELNQFQIMYANKQLTHEEFEQARLDISTLMSKRIAEEYRKETQIAREGFEKIASIINDQILQTMNDAFTNGEANFKKFLSSVVSGLTQMYFKAVILKQLMDAIYSMSGGNAGPLAGLMGSGSTVTRASGGPIAAGQMALVGERGPELIRAGRAMHVYSTAQTHQAMRSSVSGGGSVVYNIDARNSAAGVEQRIAQQLYEIERNRPHPAQQIMTMQQQYPTRF